ncbi:MAG: ABC transporter permease [Cyclobacteriaceae bacterium]|nr:ABC transporter permease [Cyclobacteriaceae bacterium]
MSQIPIIIQREYVSRVKKKSFLIASIFGPLFMAAVILFVVFITSKGVDQKNILVLDQSGYFTEDFVSTEEMLFEKAEGTEASAKDLMRNKGYYGLVYIPQFDLDHPGGYTFYSSSNPSLSIISKIEQVIDRRVEDLRLQQSGLDPVIISSFKVSTSLKTLNLSETGEETNSSSVAATIIGYLAAFMIYLFIFIYGAQCMRGVIEEKNTRIVEIILSSVKPFHLMIGKVIGIAGVGLTQFLIWMMVMFGVTTGVSAFFGMNQLSPASTAMTDPTQQGLSNEMVASALTSLGAIHMPMVVFSFLFYFVGGYVLYGALFAAVGSASDTDQDAQQFMLPVTIPLIASIISISAVLTDPNGSIAFWMSMIPFTSPVIMMVRVPFGVASWELVASMFFLIGGFLFTLWVAGRIYRVGILTHGTKVNWKTLARWFMTSA